jgi:rhodanese-related sulfurtransferase
MSQTGVQVIDLNPEQVDERLRRGQAVLVDVREDHEYAAENIAGARHLPLGLVTREAVLGLAGSRPVVFQCRSGKRSVDAALRFGEPGEQVFHLAGGILGWKESGRPTVVPRAAPKIDVMRQVQIAAGSIVLVGTLLGAFVWPWFLVLSGLIGAGLIYAGLSGWCGMAKMLAKMPWNATGKAG